MHALHNWKQVFYQQMSIFNIVEYSDYCYNFIELWLWLTVRIKTQLDTNTLKITYTEGHLM